VKSSSAATPASAARQPRGEMASALKQMYRYTTFSIVFIVLFFAFIAMSEVETPWLQVGIVAAALPAAALGFFWERRAPLWLAIVAIACATLVWWATLLLQNWPTTVILISAVLGLVFTQTRRTRWLWWFGGLAYVLAPVGVAALVSPSAGWLSYVYASALGLVASGVVFLLNRYAWNLYLQLDDARRVSAELAVAKERFRFAADLHDIQGHSLHVLKLKTQLVDKLIDRDPAAAHAHLAEAQQLINETLANTRDLAFGDRRVGVASELANASELFSAAGIGWTVTGEFSADHHEELFGLVVREATTNILRHAQPTAVEVILGERHVRVSNNGSPASTRPLSGLARLGERFAGVGGTLRTSTSDGTFVTEATIL
jgi:two-component system sensor histidine kinase DesK